MEQTVLTASGLTMRYHSTLALDNLDLTLPQGKIVGLLGPNGSGKTTFIKLAAGLLTPTAGEITICGNKIGTATKAVVSYLPDRPYFSRQVRVEQQLDFFQDFYADFDRARAEEMLSALNISLSAKFKALSKGNQEKVQLVLVMSRRAKLYLLDEPIGGVDPAARDYHHYKLRPQRHGADLHPPDCRRGTGTGRISVPVPGPHFAGRKRGRRAGGDRQVAG